METLQDQLDKDFPPRSGGREIESRGSSFDRVKAQVAAKLHQAAETLSRKAQSDQPRRQTEKLGTQAGTWLHNSADYIERIEPKKVKDDVVRHVQRNPGKSLLVAGAAGLVLAALFRRK